MSLNQPLISADNEAAPQIRRVGSMVAVNARQIEEATLRKQNMEALRAFRKEAIKYAVLTLWFSSCMYLPRLVSNATLDPACNQYH